MTLNNHNVQRQSSSKSPTRDVTSDVTRDVTSDVTRDVTSDVTRDVTSDVTRRSMLPSAVTHIPDELLKSFPHTKRVGNYLLGRTIGEGSFAKVKEGLHVVTGEQVSCNSEARFQHYATHRKTERLVLKSSAVACGITLHTQCLQSMLMVSSRK